MERGVITLFLLLLFSSFLFSSCSQMSQGSGKISANYKWDPMPEAKEGGSVLMNLRVYRTTLDNGMRVLIYPNNRLPIFSYYTYYDVGGRHERKGVDTGATHYLEHMMFKGTKKYTGKSFFNFIEGVGGNANAYTTFDSTVYHENVPSDALETVIDMESDRLNEIILDPKEVEKERIVVFEERKKSYENSPRGQLYLKGMQAIFEGTPYGGSVIGEVADLKSLTREGLLKFHDQFYAPNNAIVVIAGDVDPDKTIDLLKKYYGKLKPREDLKAFKEEKDNRSIYAHKGRYKRWIKINSTAKSPMFMMGFKGEPLGTERSYVMDVLASVIGDGNSSYLNQSFVKSRRPTLTSVSTFNYTLKHNGVFWVSGTLLDKVSLGSVKKRMAKELKKSCDKAIDERTLQKAKNQYMVGYFNGIQTNAGMASFLGSQENYYGDYSHYLKEIDIYNKITVDQLKKTCHEVFDGDEYIFLSSWEKHPKNK
jgi:zinc protease